jgi:hypothetical protein
MRKSAIPALAAVGLLTAFAGCESMFSGDTEAVQRETILTEYGGFDTADEAQAFGDPYLMAGYSDQTEYSDDMENHPEVRTASRNRAAARYSLRIVWGNLLRPDTTETARAADCPVTDWSGSLEVSGGIATVKRLIRFDIPFDHIVRPRRDPRSVSWVSSTSGHLDGIVFHIVDVPDPAGKEVSNSITITTPQHTAEIPLADLEDYRDFIEIDDCNRLSILATAVDDMSCPAGFLEGGWVAETDTSGYFRGGWLSNDGSPSGFLRGTYEIRDGERVLFGKWITASGRFGGLIRGVWRPAADGAAPGGFFEGRWVDEVLVARGALTGHYHICDGDGAGYFHGRWKRICR